MEGTGTVVGEDAAGRPAGGGDAPRRSFSLRVRAQLRRWRADLLVAVEAQKARGDDLTLHLGGEYRAGERLRLRAGYQSTENRGLAAGLGLVGKHWVIDYAYVPFGAGWGDAHWVSLQLERATP